ncbi:MAG TPA: UDP-3-O-(3-hydroxymyristoyl)glucosamine N-acyltransferase [Cryomorphaceae bacterium]|nr:UDP-3-O-(3-hydroxymyristoyl)glucosamine N-acyltransferase [Owenweeksia sp.]MBG00072.1 UDP-3-O-(3-hydroxymyristoyl)glucosamine N-acyltransferase [Owenweeksia sp.]HAD97764.1 UDP-3-O-(3-hydroxymyristoyl)glucosamine N-acyltransferase [Cryomorphaceae bacterium]HBF21809.1 UDP-3-O-(3-hydroxymyristoyl)glucosamine N-acyltransferase [Cryomorphaceae bacterium]HCQ14748.1 UDP-3-O-(3-hydroxymyristoyl)glucosamine N-acyltransferase [Cryomorphaceae bacterium]|tara:strand:+ start:607 stop:1632 length:1026 start_codon:yes stop_codon:yes gene_type:complete
MEFSAQQIADLIGGKVDGDPGIKVSSLSKIEDGQAGSLSFLANPQYTPYIYKTSASIVIVNDDFAPEENISSTLIRVPNAYQAFAKLLEVYNQLKHDKSGIESQAFVAESAQIGANCYIGAFTYIGENVVIGDNTKVYPGCYIGDNAKIGADGLLFSGVKIYPDCVVGNSVSLHSGVIVGGDGFGFAPNNESYDKVAQIGNVIIEDHVEVGANTTIDRATLGSTIIRKGVKLDNLIQIAHNVEIGENTVIASQSGVAGSTRIGKNCMIGGQVGIIGHLTIGNNVKIAAQSGIGNNLEDGEIVQGSPAFSVREYKKSYVYFRKLARMADDIDNLKKQMQSLQ